MQFNKKSIPILFFLFFLPFVNANFLIYASGRDGEFQSLIKNCNTDTCKYRILSGLFWNTIDNNFELGKFYGEQVFELFKNSDNPSIAGDVNFIKAYVYQQEELYDSAFYFFNKSFQLSQLYNNKYGMGWNHYHLAEVNDAVGRQEAAINQMKLSLKIFLEDNNLYDAHEAAARIAEMYMRTGNFDSAEVYYLKRLAIDKKTGNKSSEIWTCVQILKFYQVVSDIKNSIKYLNYALNEAEKNSNNVMTELYVEIGRYFFELKKNKQTAKEYAMKGLEKKGQDIYLYLLLSEIALAEGNDSLALHYAFSSMKNEKSRHRISQAYRTLGLIYNKTGNYKLALDYYKKCYENGCSTCPKITFHDALLGTAEIYTKLRYYDQAFSWYTKALKLAKDYNSIMEISSTELSLGNYYLLINSPAAAEKYFLDAFTTAKRTKNLPLIKKISDRLNLFYANNQDFKSAYKYSNLSRIYADSLSAIDREISLADLELKFTFEKIKSDNEAKQALASEQIKRQHTYLVSLILISLLLMIIGIVIFRNYKRKHKDNQLLLEQKNALERMSQKVHEADQKKLNFFTNISHEFRTPLTLILGPIEKLIKDTPENRSSLPMLNMVRRNTLHLYNLINQLLDIRKLDTGNIKLKVTKDDIACYSKGIYSTFIHLAQENNVNYYFDSEVDSLQGWFDKDIVEKVLNNLLSNAFKYTEKSGEILINLSPVSKEGSHIKLVIRDNGKGIPEDQIQYVFDRYYQVENTNTGFNTGTGIGLAYTKELLELHKGEISVESRPGSGTSFTIILPIDESFYSADEKSTIEVHKNNKDTDDIRQKYLEEIIKPEASIINLQNKELRNEESNIMLIVEDNTDLREFIKSIFSEEYVIHEAPDGICGYNKAIELIPDIIISDIMMPGMDGLELCNKLKSNLHTNHIPVLFLTAKSGNENEKDGFKTGADDYVIKPFDSEILTIRVNRLIESKKKLREYFTREFIMNPAEVKLTSPDDEFLKKAVKIVEDNISNPELNVEMLTRELCMSRMQLHRKLKALTNYSAAIFIRNIKLKRAAQLLKQNSLNITEVLYESGFNSPSYFSSCFKEMYGCLPKEYSSKTD